MPDLKKLAASAKAVFRKSRKHLIVVGRVLIVLMVVFLIVFLPMKAAGNVAVSNFTDSYRSFFASVRGGEGYPMSFDEGEVSDIAAMGKSVFTYSGKGITVYNGRGAKLLEKDISYLEPVVEVQNGRAVYYSVGAKNLTLFSRTEVLGEIPTEENITAASLNEDGMVAIAHFSEDSKTSLDVYNKKMQNVFSWNCTTYIADVSVSDNGKRAAVITVKVENADIHSKVIILDLKKGEQLAEFDYPSNTLYALKFAGGYDLNVIGDNVRSFIKNCKEKEDFKYGNDTLQKFDFAQDGGFALLFYVKGSAAKPKLVIYKKNGDEKGSVELEKYIKSMSFSNDYVSVLNDSDAITYNTKGREVGRASGAQQYRKVESGGGVLWLFGSGTITKVSSTRDVELK